MKFPKSCTKLNLRVDKAKQGGENVNVIFEKELPESKEHEIVSGIIDIFRENGVSFRQAFELLTAVQLEIQKISLKKSS